MSTFDWSSTDLYFQDTAFAMTTLLKLESSDIDHDQNSAKNTSNTTIPNTSTMIDVRKATFKSNVTIDEDDDDTQVGVAGKDMLPGTLIWAKEANSTGIYWPCMILNQIIEINLAKNKKLVMWMGEEHHKGPAHTDTFILFKQGEKEFRHTAIIRKVGKTQGRKYKVALDEARYVDKYGCFPDDSDDEQDGDGADMNSLLTVAKRDDAELMALSSYVSSLATKPISNSVTILIASCQGDYQIQLGAGKTLNWGKVQGDDDVAISLCCHANLSELALEDVLAASSAINQTRLNVLRERITKKILQEQQEREFEQQGQQVQQEEEEEGEEKKELALTTMTNGLTILASNKADLEAAINVDGFRITPVLTNLGTHDLDSKNESSTLSNSTTSGIQTSWIFQQNSRTKSREQLNFINDTFTNNGGQATMSDHGTLCFTFNGEQFNSENDMYHHLAELQSLNENDNSTANPFIAGSSDCSTTINVNDFISETIDQNLLVDIPIHHLALQLIGGYSNSGAVAEEGRPKKKRRRSQRNK